LEDFSIKKEGAGIVGNDIEILLSHDDTKKLILAIDRVKKELASIDGIIFVDDSAKFGTKELKLDLNEYGKYLGFTQSDLGIVLSSSYLEGRQAKVLGVEGIIEIKTKDLRKDDLQTLKNYELKTPDGLSSVILSDICTFSYKKSFEMLYKHNGSDVKVVFANVNHKKITPTEVLAKIKPILEELKSDGVSISLQGEQEQNEQMMKEMSYAFLIAIFLIFITLLVMFDSYVQTFMLLSIIPLSVFGAIVGHMILDMNFTLTSVIGILGLAGVVINDGVIMLDFIRRSKSVEDLLDRAKLRLRPILITSITTFLGLSTLIFFASGQAKILQPVAVSLGFGLLWGTVLTLLYLPAIYASVYRKKLDKKVVL
jgi:multidrug efflux pump subunit AcrB